MQLATAAGACPSVSAVCHRSFPASQMSALGSSPSLTHSCSTSSSRSSSRYNITIKLSSASSAPSLFTRSSRGGPSSNRQWEQPLPLRCGKSVRHVSVSRRVEAAEGSEGATDSPLPSLQPSPLAQLTAAASVDQDEKNATSPSSSNTPNGNGNGPQGPLDHPDLPYSSLTFFALLGAGETLYLTYEKLFGGPITCPFGGSCNDVLDSSYGTLLGLPLSLYGFMSYSAIIILTQVSKTNARRRLLQDNMRWLLLALTSVMGGVSLFLLYVIKFELDSAFCAYCFASAGLSGLLLFLTFQGFSQQEVTRVLAPQAGLVAATIVALSVAFGDARSAFAGVQEIDLPPVEPEVTTVSSPLQVRLAKHLSAYGAKMYGAFWCSHCYDQKQAFGQEASKALPYVECYPEGYRRGVKIAQACEDAKIEGFPTWIINGEMRPGEQDLVELARLTGFDVAKASK